MKNTLFLAFIFVSFLFLAGCSYAVDPNAEKLVTHMEQTGVKMYGAFWCGHCEDQKKILGETVRNIYVECDARGKKEQAELCIEKGIEGYPSFELVNGSLISGVHSVRELAEITGLSLD